MGLLKFLLSRRLFLYEWLLITPSAEIILNIIVLKARYYPHLLFHSRDVKEIGKRQELPN